MSDLSHLHHEDAPIEEVENVLDQALQAQFDTQLKAKWARQLEEDHDVVRALVVPPRKQPYRLWAIGLGIAAGLALAVILFFAPGENQNLSLQELALQHLNQTEILYTNSTKGESDSLKNKIKAIQAFNATQYAKAFEYYSQLPHPQQEDLYYMGLAALLSQQYPEAVAHLGALASQDSPFNEEVNWYVSMAYILNAQPEAARKQLRQIHASEWNYDMAQSWLNQMD